MKNETLDKDSLDIQTYKMSRSGLKDFPSFVVTSFDTWYISTNTANIKVQQTELIIAMNRRYSFVPQSGSKYLPAIISSTTLKSSCMI